MFIVFTKVLEVFAILAIGFIANKKGILPAESNPYLVKLLLVITSPCLIVTSIASKELTPDTFKETIYVFIATMAFFIIGAFLAHVILKLLKVKPVEDRGVLEVLVVSVNSGFMGFPISLLIFGQDGFYYMVICNITLTFYVYSLAMVQMGSSVPQKKSLWGMIKPMFNLCILAAIIGVFLLFTGLKLPESVFECLETIGNATIPLAMIVVGVLFGESNIKSTITDKNLLIVTVLGMVVWPILTFLALNWLPIPVMPKAMVIFASAFPSAAVVPALAQQQGRNGKLAAQGVSITTLASLITVPLVAIFLISYYGIG